MAYNRPLGAEPGTIRMACSICGNSFLFPLEIRYCSDRLFRCNVFCTEAETPLDYERKQSVGRQTKEQQITFPMGPKPGWEP